MIYSQHILQVEKVPLFSAVNLWNKPEEIKQQIIKIILSNRVFVNPPDRQEKLHKLKQQLKKIILSRENPILTKIALHPNSKLPYRLSNLYLDNVVKIMNPKLKEFIKQNYPIQTWLNNPILRKKSESINISEIKSDEIQDFAQILFAAMELYDGIWLAAPQIWLNKRMIAVCQLDKSEKNVVWADVLINPEIIEKSWEYISEEACLSLPGLEWKVKRYNYVKVKYYDIDRKEKTIEATKLNAAILQHEIDHLDWILFWDKVINKQPQINFEKLVQNL